MLGMSYGEQLQRKRRVLGRELRNYDSLANVHIPRTLSSPKTIGYRNRVRMAVGISRHGGTRLGYFRSGTREIVDTPDCGVIAPELLDTTRRIRELLNTAGNIPRELRHLDLLCGSDPRRQHLILVFRADEMPPFPLEALRRATPAVDGISVNLNPKGGSQVIRGAIQHLWGEREIWVHHAGMQLRVSPGAFFQVNLSILPAIHELMDRYLSGGNLLIDLYAGVGTHGFALGHSYRRVLYVEGSRAAVSDLKSTARDCGGREFEVLSSSVERSLRRLRQRRPDAIILNPSRAGALEPVLEMIGNSSAKQVLYLSCAPRTLCRDLDLLARHDYDTVSVQPVDMMPWTSQIEALALLRAK